MSPGALLRTAAVSSVEVVTGRSPTAVTTSPACSPAFAAALPGSTETISAPLPTPEFWSSAAVRVLTPRNARVAVPFAMSSLAIRCAVFAGIANPTPMFPLCDCDPGAPEATVAIALLMPMTSPAPLTSAPPELPGLIAASVWMRVDDGGVVLRGAGRDGPAGGADDPVGDGVGQPQRGADRHRDVADLHLVGVRERGRGQPARAVELDDGEVGGRVGADDRAS